MGRMAGTDVSFNANSKYRTYSYHFILVVCDSTSTAEAIGQASGDLSIFASGSTSTDLHPVTAAGGQAFVLINGMTDSHYVIRSATWMSVRRSSGGEAEHAGSADTLDGEIVVEEPGGIDFLNTLTEVTRAIGSRPIEQVFLLKTIFVGHTTDGETVVDAGIGPMYFAPYNIVADIKASGVVYSIEIVGMVNGVGLIGHNASATWGSSFTIPAGTKLSDGLKIVEDDLNEENRQNREKLLKDSEQDQAGNDLIKDGKPIMYKLLATPELADKIIGTNIKVQEQEVGNGDANIAAGQREPVQSFLEKFNLTTDAPNRELDPTSSQRETPAGREGPFKTSKLTDANTGKPSIAGGSAGSSAGGEKKESKGVATGNKQELYKVHVVDTSTPDKKELTYVLAPYESGQNPVAGCADFSPDASELIEFDYIFTGKNVDIKDLDLKLSLGNAFFQSRAASSAKVTQEQAATGTISSQPFNGSATSYNAGELCGSGLKNSSFPAIVTVGSNWVAGGATEDYFADLSNFIGLNTINLKMTVIGHPVLMNETVMAPSEFIKALLRPKSEPKSSATVSPNSTKIPPYARVNIKYPAKNSPNAQGQPTLKLLYEGVYHILIIRNIFDGGEFTQELDMISVPAKSPIKETAKTAVKREQKALADKRGQTQGRGGGLTTAQGAGRRAADGNFSSNEEFVNAVRPAAEKAGAELGVDPNVIIAQAALESGWGKRPISKADGTNGFNVFGIKADRSWKGERNTVGTHEVRGGTRVSEQGSFRVYNSYDESFADYVNFIKTNPRYKPALNHGGDSAHYVRGLQTAGYATDPTYAGKILQTANGGTIRRASMLAQNSPTSQASASQLDKSSTKTAAANTSKSPASTNARKITGGEKLALKIDRTAAMIPLDEKLGV